MEIDSVNPASPPLPPTTMSSDKGPGLSVEQLAAGLEKMMINENGKFGRYDPAMDLRISDPADKQIQWLVQSFSREGTNQARVFR